MATVTDQCADPMPFHPSPGAVRGAISTENKNRSVWKGIAVFLVSFSLYYATLLGIIGLPWWPARIMCVALNGFLLGTLLAIGHDAAHDSLTPWGWLNALLGRLAFLPALHPYSIWERGHDRVHHDFTNLHGYDYVWSPFSKEEFDRLPWHQRLLQRTYRTVPGMGLYYFIEFWVKHAVLRHKSERLRDKIHYGWTASLDQMLVLGFLLAQGTALCLAHEYLAGVFEFSAISPVLVLCMTIVVPFLMFCWLGGFFTFQHHTHPRIRWYNNREEWSFFKAAVQGTAHIVYPWPMNLFLHHLMEHTAHHVDSKIPLYQLGGGQKDLETAFPSIVVETFSMASFLRTLSVCQLYDYVNHRWLDFDGQPTTESKPTQPDKVG
jgi:omega-6 fatty acid desaturase (delta-12 desaturase)